MSSSKILYSTSKSPTALSKEGNPLIELKSRRCKSDTYPTTMIGFNKLQMAKRQSKDVYFCFGFTDGLFFHKVENDNDYHIQKGGRWDRGKAEINNYVYIPINQLTKV